MSAQPGEVRQLPRHEAALAAAVTRQAAVFADAIGLLDRIHSQVDLSSPSAHSSMTAMQQVLEQVTVAQTQVSDAHAGLKRSGARLSDSLRQELSRQEALLRTLLERMDTVSRKFEAARSAILPQLDESTIRRSMQNAYRNSLRTL